MYLKYHAVSTFHPNHLTHECHVDLSGRFQAKIHLSDAAAFKPVNLQYGCKRTGSAYRFPEGTHGFFYYFSPDWAPRLAGQLRFRITSSPDPASFSSGTDLQRNGVPWSKSLASMSRWNDGFDMLQHSLSRDNLVSEDTLSLCRRVASLPRRNPPRILYAFGQPFYMKFGSKSAMHVIDTSNDTEDFIFVIWALPRRNNQRVYPSTYRSHAILPTHDQQSSQMVLQYVALSFQSSMNMKAHGLSFYGFSR